MQSRSILFLLIVLVLAAGSGYLMAKKPVSYGLDVRGGVRLLYRMDLSTLTPEQKADLPQIQSRLISIMENRAGTTLGVAEPVVAKKGEDGLIIELPGYTNIDEAREVISTTAKVIVYWAKTVSTDLHKSRRYQRTEGGKEIDGVKYETFVRTSDPTKTIEPGQPEYVDLINSWDKILEGDEVSGAAVQVSGAGTRPEFFFSDKGANKLEAWSRRYLNQGENIAFVLDNRVLNIAPVAQGAILSNEAYIKGDFPPKYVKNLTESIKSGSLPVGLIPLSSEQVDPTIGKQALVEMEKAGIISLVIISVLLVFYYRFPGVIAALAMMLYALFTLAFLNGVNATFSLAAIAAFILSVGMAVDANILVFERLKEELRSGKDLARATTIAFKRALKAIVDSNISTILTCGVLYAFGTGPVKGFATTLAVGVVISFVTAFVVTRVLMQAAHAMGFGKNVSLYASTKGWYLESQQDDEKHHLLNIIGRSKTYFLVSAVLIVPGLIAMGMGGIKPNVEFQGGFEGTYKLPAGRTQEQIREGLKARGIEGINVKFSTAGTERVVYLTIPPVKGMTVDDPKAKEMIATAAGLPVEGSSFTAIGPSIQKETVNNAFLAVVFSSLLIMVYLGVRFGLSVGGLKNGIKFGASAVLALIHDVLFVLGSAAIVGLTLGWEISALFITAMLTVIGFSVHDTIIIFDRIRENLQSQAKGESFEHLCDKSVTQSVARSINTSLSAIIPLGILLFIGTPTPELKLMCLSMLLGISIGAYSSIFNATPILYLWDKAVMKRKGAEHGLMAEAQREAKVRAQLAAAGGAPTVGVMQPQPQQPAAGSQYGQVKRRSAVEQSKRNVDDED